jgi:hypothetical protein
MKDLEKIKEFFLKDRAMTAAYEGNTEYFKPVIRKDKNSPSILYVDIAYPEGSGVLSIGGSKTMSGQDRETGAEKAMKDGEKIRQILLSKYNIEDSDVNDLKNGIVQVFAVSDDFAKMSTPSLNENFPGPGEVVDAKYLNNAMLDYFNRMNIKLLINTKTEKGIKGGVGTMYGDLVFNGDDIKLKDIVSVEIIESSISEAKKEDKVDTITMDVPLFIRMLEYSREDAAEDMDLHDVTEKAISLGKERGILQMDDYDEIIGTTEKVVKEEVSFLSLKDDNPFDDIPSIEIQLIDDKEGISSPKAFVNISSMGHGGENGKMEILKNNPALQDKVMKELQIEFQKTFRRVIHSILGEPFGLDEKKVKAEKTSLEKKITEALDKINEELCPAGKAYIKRRQAAGEKSSAYLSGRAVKVCKGQMSGKKKKK